MNVIAEYQPEKTTMAQLWLAASRRSSTAIETVQTNYIPELRMTTDRVDISIVLNLHDEARFLKRTMTSIEDAVTFAASYGITCEVVCVLDRPDAATKAWIEGHDFSYFGSKTIVEVDNGSLGLSRNDGIARANKGEYIYLCDADDLISYNMLVRLHQTNVSEGPRTIVFPELIFGFGTDFHLARFFGTDRISKLGFFHYHPYVSRVFAHRSLFDAVRFVDARLSGGFAYEDWHFNCEALARGYEFCVVRQTVLFYRQRHGSLLESANAISIRHPMLSAYHKPRVFNRVCEKDFIRHCAKQTFHADREQVRRNVLSDRAVLELIHRANVIDPAVDANRLFDCAVWTNADTGLAPAAAYFRACEQIATLTFSHVFLLPFLTTGGADRYILEFIAALTRAEPGARILVIFGERIDRHQWLEKLPRQVTFIDIPLLELSSLDDAAIRLVTLRIIQTCAPKAKLFLKTCGFAIDFFRKFSVVLSENACYYFYFSDRRIYIDGLMITCGYSFDFLSEYGHRLDGIISDNVSIIQHALNRLDNLTGRTHAIYAPVEQSRQRRDYRAKPMTRRVLWASRLDSEKRPLLLRAIGLLLERGGLDVTIDVYGSAVLGPFDIEILRSTPRVDYKGAFSDFSALRPWDYDAFLYTSAYDGLPNVVLEAMSAGLVVIAPNVGGIAEAVTPERGFLVEDDGDDDRLVHAYIDRIARLYSNETDLATMSAAATELIATRHSRDEFARKVVAVMVPVREGNADAANPHEVIESEGSAAMNSVETFIVTDQRHENGPQAYVNALLESGGEILATSLRTWRAGMAYEVEFWSRWFETKGLEWPDDYAIRTKPKPLDPWVESLLPCFATQAFVLDVGSGPITQIGIFSDKMPVSVTAVDPLAFQYSAIAKAHHVTLPLETKFSFAEDLSARFNSGTFDVITCTNALDHTIEPVWGLLEMIIVCKIGGKIFLSHRRNEAEYEKYSGFHQWNFDSEDNHFIIWQSNRRIDCSALLEQVAFVECKSAGEHIAVTITKKAELPVNALEYQRKARAALLETLLKA